MAKLKLMIGTLALVALGACSTLQRGQSVADYCANPDKAAEAVCQLNLEIAGTRTALSETNLSVDEARALAASSMSAAEKAQSSAAAAQATADAALAKAKEASTTSMDDLYCETKTINRTDTGSCDAGFQLMSCTQTRYTTRAGGLSFLREINNQQCRFNSRVLEMQVRCCQIAPKATSTSISQATPLPGSEARPVAVASTEPVTRIVRRVYVTGSTSSQR